MTMKKFISAFSIVAMIFGSIGYNPTIAVAAQMTGVKDTISTVTVNTTATHAVQWTLPGTSKNTVNDTIAIDFVAADIVPSGTWQVADFTFTGNAAGSNVAPAAVGTTGTPATCSGSTTTNYIVNVDAAAGTFTITLCTGWTQSASAFASTFTINGTAASGTGLLTNKATDVDSSVFTITDTGDDTDSATGAVVAETNGTVNITATVSPTLTFSNDDNSIGFGALSASGPRYATGSLAGSGTTVTAHTMTVGTNATTGYTLTYNGPTLTSGANTIAPATITGTANGTTGADQFALGATVTGTGTVTSGYSTAANDYKFVASTVSQVASATGPVTSDSIAVRYLANIPASKPAGNYSTNLDWVATGNF